jgi:hypothetical protein
MKPVKEKLRNKIVYNFITDMSNFINKYIDIKKYKLN